MKKYFAMLAMAASLLTACDKTIYVESVSLDQTSVTLIEGQSTTLVATVSPVDAENMRVTWTSDNEPVATVEAGKIQALQIGKANITVTTEDGGKTATCQVTVRGIEFTPVFTEEFESFPNAKDGWLYYNFNQAEGQEAFQPIGFQDDHVYISSYWDAKCKTEAWLVSPKISLKDADYAKMTFKEYFKYADAGQLSVMVAVDPALKIAGGADDGFLPHWWIGGQSQPAGTWAQIAIPNHAAAAADSYVESGDLDLNEFVGETIRVAFKYIGTTELAGTWNIDTVVVYSGK